MSLSLTARWQVPGQTLLALAAVITLCACPASPPEPDPDAGIELRVAPFEVPEQQDGGEFVGAAFAESMAINLSQAVGLRAAAGPAGADAPPSTRTLVGSITRDDDEVYATLRLLDPAGDVDREEVIDSQGTDLSGLAVRASRWVAQAVGVEFADSYDYIGNVTGGPEMAASPLRAQAADAWSRGDDARFVESTAELVTRFPRDPASHVLNAWALLHAWDNNPLSETLASLRERLIELDRVDPASPYDEFLLGYVYRASGEPDKARILYSRVLSRDDLTDAARSWALRQSCHTYVQAGNPGAGRDDAERAVLLDPSSAANLIALSRALEDLGELEGAIEASTKALALEPFVWRHLQRLGLVLFHAGRTEESETAMQQACELGQAQEACANAAVVVHRHGRVADARDLARHATTLTDTQWGLYNLACFHALAGDSQAAMRDLERSFELGYADVLIETDHDLDSLRDTPEFDALLAKVAERLRTRRAQSNAVFPWQG
jgi:tetratricopeptide (TPR) repeat protein